MNDAGNMELKILMQKPTLLYWFCGAKLMIFGELSKKSAKKAVILPRKIKKHDN